MHSRSRKQGRWQAPYCPTQAPKDLPPQGTEAYWERPLKSR
ncbi:hypothetical protein EVA_07495 [gut metagenome]|uniref:Uncharacterized protein n=1 Tax=gut metagenome TaxID=749906 RepID=J9GAQ9_9ZZZZ